MSGTTRRSKRQPKRTDVRDYERAMEDVRRGILDREIDHTVDAMMRQAYLDDPHSGAYSLPELVQDLPVELRYLDDQQ